MMFERELAVYHAHKDDLLGVGDVNEGKYVVIKDDQIKAPFDTWEDALRYGYETHGLDLFLVKKIERIPTVLYFSRPI